MIEDGSLENDSTPTQQWEAIARHLAGESSEEESERVRQWLEAHPMDKALVEQLSSIEVSEAADVDVEAALTKVHSRMEHRGGAPRLTLERGNGSAAGTARRPAAWALAVLAAAAAVLAIVTLRKPAAVVSPAVGHTYATRTGQRDSIMLADGSRVILGPDSRLTVPADFGSTARAVELQGDGYFDVHHDPSKPFSVRVGTALVEDIGTTFMVESDAGDSTSVSVLSGSVRLRPSGSAPTAGAILAAGDRGSLSVDGQVRSYPKTVRSDDSTWTTGRVVFHDASLGRIAGEIRRWYGVDLHVADSSLLAQHVTTTFDDNDSVDQVLKSLALVLGARVERQGNSATIHANHGSSIVR